MPDYEMGRPRSARFRHLPPNLIPDPKANGTVYYRYRMPDGTREPMGKDEAKAIAAANALNVHFTKADDLVGNALGPKKASFRNPLLSDLIDDYDRHMRQKRLSEGTIKGKAIKLREYKRTWPDRTVQAMDTLTISRFLEGKSPHAYGKHRVLLCDLMQFACHQGYQDDNPARRTLENKGRKPKKTRRRHTWEGYCATYDAAEPWLQRAMSLALYLVQRRQDLVILHRDKVDMERGTLRVFQQKSENYQKPVYIDIEMGGELLAVVKDCIGSEVPCPYLIHRRPKRIRPEDRKAKPHPFAVTLDYLSTSFSKARDRAGAYDDMPKAARPTFHELRAFGIHLYREAGFGDEYIMALSGHAGKEMVDHYAKDHDTQPVLVRAGLSLT